MLSALWCLPQFLVLGSGSSQRFCCVPMRSLTSPIRVGTLLLPQLSGERAQKPI